MLLTFTEFLREGGNVVIGDKFASRIDLSAISRTDVVKEIDSLLNQISDRFKKMYGEPLWKPELLKSKKFLSGSSIHLFDLKNITNQDFIKHKPLVGDIDTQVDESRQSKIEEFLKAAKDIQFNGFSFVGFKKSGDQFITLWLVKKFGINVQIDLELVKFIDGSPTAWSTFSHSSSWEDIQIGVKGAFHKLLLRAFQARSARDIIVRTKTGKEKIINKSHLAFSLKGLRVKYSPVVDDKGTQELKNGLPVFNEIPTNESAFITDLDLLFSSFFGVLPQKGEIEKLKSFVGLTELINRYCSQEEKQKIVTGFANILWEKGAQGLVRGNPTEDFDTKKIAFNILTNLTGKGDIADYKFLIDNYYKDYK